MVIAAVGMGVDMGDMVDITPRGMRRPATWCASAAPAVRVIITGIGDMDAGTVILVVMGIPTDAGMATAAK